MHGKVIKMVNIVNLPCPFLGLSSWMAVTTRTQSPSPLHCLAGDSHLAPGELIQGVKPTPNVTESFSPAELVFCRVRSQKVLTGGLAGCAGAGAEAA